MATPEEKQATLNGHLEHGVVMLHLDARRPGVRVPDKLKNEEWLRLNVNHEKGKGDLQVNAWGVRETLRFSGNWFEVSIPWSAVFAISRPEDSQHPVIFAEDLPEEMVEAAIARLQREGHSLEELEANRPRPLWSERTPRPTVAAAPAPAPAPAPAAPSEPTASSDESVPPASTPPRRGHLRLVK